MRGEEPRSCLLLDTCIVEYLAEPTISGPILRGLYEFSDERYSYCISEITLFESLHTAPVQVEKGRQGALEFFGQLPIVPEVLLLGARLGSLYKETGRGGKEISIADKIIAATAVLNSAPICTANGKDFPYPLFKSVRISQVGYVFRERDESLILYFLEPQKELIADMLVSRKESK